MATEREEAVAAKVAVVAAAKAMVAEAAVEVARAADGAVVKIGGVERVPPHAAVAVEADRAKGKTEKSRVKARRPAVRPLKKIIAVVKPAAEKPARQPVAIAEFCSSVRRIPGQAYASWPLSPCRPHRPRGPRGPERGGPNTAVFESCRHSLF